MDLIDRDALGVSLFPLGKKDAADIYKLIMDAPAVNRWIPVEDALPEEGVSVICYMRIGEIVVMEYGGDGWYCGVTRYNPIAITHWMPIPEIPEQPEKEYDDET